MFLIGGPKLKENVRWQFGQPPAGNANFAWLQHMIWHMAPNGRMGIVLANGSLSSQTSGDGEIRRKIIEADLVNCIIAMPPQLFYTTQIPVYLWFLANNKKQNGKTLFIDARKMGTMVSRRLRELINEDIEMLGKTYKDYTDNNYLPARVNQDVSIIRANKKFVLPSYILYFLQLCRFRIWPEARPVSALA